MPGISYLTTGYAFSCIIDHNILVNHFKLKLIIDILKLYTFWRLNISSLLHWIRE